MLLSWQRWVLCLTISICYRAGRILLACASFYCCRARVRDVPVLGISGISGMPVPCWGVPTCGSLQWLGSGQAEAAAEGGGRSWKRISDCLAAAGQYDSPLWPLILSHQP